MTNVVLIRYFLNKQINGLIYLQAFNFFSLVVSYFDARVFSDIESLACLFPAKHSTRRRSLTILICVQTWSSHQQNICRWSWFNICTCNALNANVELMLLRAFIKLRWKRSTFYSLKLRFETINQCIRINEYFDQSYSGANAQRTDSRNWPFKVLSSTWIARFIYASFCKLHT